MNQTVTNPYALPDANGNCPNPNAILLKQTPGPPHGQCYLTDTHRSDPNNQPCWPNPPSFYYELKDRGLSPNHELAYCAPTCSKTNPCPELLRDPRSGKTLQGKPTCTADLGDTPDDFVGHCYLSRSRSHHDFSENYIECNKYTDPTEKFNCINAAYIMHTYYDDLLHLSPSYCQTQYDKAKPLHEDINNIIKETPQGQELFNNWCNGDIDPVYFSGAETREFIIVDNNNYTVGCAKRYGDLPSACDNVHCNQFNDEKFCRTDPTISPCCRWKMGPISDFDTSDNIGLVNMALINKPSPPPPPPPSLERFT